MSRDDERGAVMGGIVALIFVGVLAAGFFPPMIRYAVQYTAIWIGAGALLVTQWRYISDSQRWGFSIGVPLLIAAMMRFDWPPVELD